MKSSVELMNSVAHSGYIYRTKMRKNKPKLTLKGFQIIIFYCWECKNNGKSKLDTDVIHVWASVALFRAHKTQFWGNAIRHPPKVGRVGNRLQKTTY